MISHDLDRPIGKKDVQTAWAKIAEPITEQIWRLIDKIQNLCRTRDLLLPRLLSGQVELAADERFHPNSSFHHPVKHGKGLK